MSKTPVTAQAQQSKARKDPANRHADGDAITTGLKDADPEMSYVYVNENAQEMGVSFYEEIGFERCTYGDGNPRPIFGRTGKPGDYVTFRGHVLMAMPKADHEKIKLYGAPGAGHGIAHGVRREKLMNAQTRRDLLNSTDGAARHMQVAQENVETVL